MNKVIVKIDNYLNGDLDVLEFDNVVGHQVGNGAIQIVFNNGVQKILFNPSEVDIIPDAKTQAKWLEQSEAAYNGEGETQGESEKCAPKLEVVE